MKYVTRYNKTHYVYKYIRRDLYEAFIKWCGEDSINLCLEKALKVLVADADTTTVTSITHNIQPNTSPNIASGKPQGDTVVKCYEKTKMKYSLQSYIALFKSKGILVDWWEEEDNKVCFELKKQ